MTAQEQQKPTLTSLSRGSGCGCKIAPRMLTEMLSGAADWPVDPRVMVGHETHDDAAVVMLPGGQALISTVDFFMPMVDDPRDFGKIAAANALSDVYAMGGRPLVALSVLGWPVDRLPPEMAREVLEGARLVCQIAGIQIAGGHSVDSLEPFFGLAVNGLVAPERVRKNHTVREGDLLYLTKPVGSGVITAALRRGQADPQHLQEAVAWMIRLNDIGAAASELNGVHAMTDVTGFGLAGHLLEMIRPSGCSARIHQVPVMPAAESYLSGHVYPDMTMKNFSAFSAEMNALGLRQILVACDPQTSGGLLVSVAPGAREEWESLMRHYGVPEACRNPIGEIIPRGEHHVQVLF